MIVTVQQVQTGISRYIKEELARKKTGPAKFAINFLDELVSPAITSRILSLQSVPLLSDVLFDENGNIHLSALADAARSAFEKTGGKVQALGFVFDQSDVDTLIKYIIQ